MPSCPGDRLSYLSRGAWPRPRHCRGAARADVKVCPLAIYGDKLVTWSRLRNDPVETCVGETGEERNRLGTVLPVGGSDRFLLFTVWGEGSADVTLLCYTPRGVTLGGEPAERFSHEVDQCQQSHSPGLYFFLAGRLPPKPCCAVTVRSITSFSAGMATPVTITASPPAPANELRVGKTNGR